MSTTIAPAAGAPMSTLYLNPDTWDWDVDVNGNWAVAAPPYALAQDAASACRCFLAELWYDQSFGIDYWGQFLGKPFNPTLLRSALVSTALTVPGVVGAQAFFASLVGRLLTGQIQVTDTAGTITPINTPFGNLP